MDYDVSFWRAHFYAMQRRCEELQQINLSLHGKIKEWGTAYNELNAAHQQLQKTVSPSVVNELNRKLYTSYADNLNLRDDNKNLRAALAKKEQELKQFRPALNRSTYRRGPEFRSLYFTRTTHIRPEEIFQRIEAEACGFAYRNREEKYKIGQLFEESLLPWTTPTGRIQVTRAREKREAETN